MSEFFVKIDGNRVELHRERKDGRRRSLMYVYEVGSKAYNNPEVGACWRIIDCLLRSGQGKGATP